MDLDRDERISEMDDIVGQRFSHSQSDTADIAAIKQICLLVSTENVEEPTCARVAVAFIESLINREMPVSTIQETNFRFLQGVVRNQLMVRNCEQEGTVYSLEQKIKESCDIGLLTFVGQQELLRQLEEGESTK